MKVIATADLHGTLPKIPACDLLIIAGDVCPVWDHNLAFQSKWLRDTFTFWLTGCLYNGVKNIVWIPGNHDFVLEDSFKLRAEMMRVDKRIHFLVDKLVIIEGLRIYGTPWTPHLPNWAYAAEEGDPAFEKFQCMPADLDILISHGPPIGFGDRVSHAGHVGSCALLDVITMMKPKLTICGHIHEGFGLYEKNDIEVWNVSYLDEFYEPTHELVEIGI